MKILNRLRIILPKIDQARVRPFRAGNIPLKPSLLLPCFILMNLEVCAQYKSYRIDPTVEMVDGSKLPFREIRPGDTLLLLPGPRNQLVIAHISGNASRQVVLMNKGGTSKITGKGFGISIRDCRYFRCTGTGDRNFFYGIQILGVERGAGIGIGSGSSDIELDHISIDQCPIAGIYAKTDPDCSFQVNRDLFTQYHTVIHDNYIAHTGNEGMYIGSSHYSGMALHCQGRDTVVLPPVLIGVKVYNNIVYQSGWDGIQVSSAYQDCQIFDNLVIQDSRSAVKDQMSGILIGGGTRCVCDHNLIMDGKGDGIEFLGLCGSRIFQNIIVRPGQDFLPNDLSIPKHGIFARIPSGNSNQKSIWIDHNIILFPKTNPIRILQLGQVQVRLKENLLVGGSSLSGGIYLGGPKDGISQIYNAYFPELQEAGVSLNNYGKINSPRKSSEGRLIGSRGANVSANTLTPEGPFGEGGHSLTVNQILPVQEGNFLFIPYLAKSTGPILLTLFQNSGKKIREIGIHPQKTGMGYAKVNLKGVPKGPGLYSFTGDVFYYQGTYNHY